MYMPSIFGTHFFDDFKALGGKFDEWNVGK